MTAGELRAGATGAVGAGDFKLAAVTPCCLCCCAIKSTSLAASADLCLGAAPPPISVCKGTHPGGGTATTGMHCCWPRCPSALCAGGCGDAQFDAPPSVLPRSTGDRCTCIAVRPSETPLGPRCQ